MMTVAVDEEAALSVRGQLGLPAEELGQLGVGVFPEGAPRGGVEVAADV